MKFLERLGTNLLGMLTATGILRWMSTLEYKCAYYDPAVDPVHPDYQGRKIYIFWHEYIFFPIYLRGHCNLSMLLSRHGDAEVLSRVAYHLGFDFVRGSTRRGGVVALRAMLAKSDRMNLTMTPDGPRGPRRKLAPGPIYLASKLGMPLVVMGFGYDRPWRMPTWDRFAVPRLCSRARAVVSPALHIPPDMERDGVEHYREYVERLLNRLTEEAEDWAESDRRMENEVPLYRQAAGGARKVRMDWKHELRGPMQARQRPLAGRGYPV